MRIVFFIVSFKYLVLAFIAGITTGSAVFAIRFRKSIYANLRDHLLVMLAREHHRGNREEEG